MNFTIENGGELLYLTFNQDQGCFACGTERGFYIWNCEPLKERFRREFDGGIGIVEMLFRCNILALVGGGKNPKYPPNKVMIWDDYQNKCIAELEFRSEVRSVKLRRDRIVVILETKVYVYNFADLQLLHQIESASNPKGLCALAPETAVLACPGLKPGYVHIELYESKQTRIIPAHNNPLSQIVLNTDGSRMASASEKGTLIRVFDTASGNQLHEFRRGADRAVIYSLSFNVDSTALCVSSDKGTVHIYGLTIIDNAMRNQESKNKQSSLSFMRDILPSYFSSYWSAAQFHVAVPAVCAFGQKKNSVLVVCADGTFYQYIFDMGKEGDCKQEFVGKWRDDLLKPKP